MKLSTRVFGEVEISEDKILTFPNGIIGFPDMTRFTLMHDSEKDDSSIHWLQSVDEPSFAMPVIDPLYVKEDYNPLIEDDVLTDLQPLNEDNTLVLVTLTVPRDLKKMTVNLKGPIIVNTESRKASQIIVEDDDCSVKFPIYDILQKIKEEAAKK
ncbi:MAG: flagellar assembly protein FliW [Lachnospiraceae bacterium]|nr:flagellar assembly protein FliW [Lachnospiraceae bacterium]